MKTTNLNGVRLYTNTDTLPEKIANGRSSRFSVGKNYAILGLCDVPESKSTDGKTTISAYTGVYCVNLASDKAFTASVNSILGVAVAKVDDKWQITNVSKPLFSDIHEAIKRMPMVVSCNEVEKLDVNIFGTDDIVKKDFYNFSEVAEKSSIAKKLFADLSDETVETKAPKAPKAKK